MIYLGPPVDQNGQLFADGQVYDLCVNSIRNKNLKESLINNSQNIKDAEAVYRGNASLINRLYKVISPKISVTKDQMLNLYKNKMLRKNSSGRKVYSSIVLRATYRRCPYCGIVGVRSLDHYLPKSLFPAYSVTPNNLVPSCSHCQTEKGDYFPEREEEQIIHPYFDNFSDYTWLLAEIVWSKVPVFMYSVSSQAGLTPMVQQRLEFHMKKLDLHNLFSNHAASEMAGERTVLEMVLNDSGVTSVIGYLQFALAKAKSINKNSWQSAMYQAALSDPNFYNGGFKLFKAI